MYVFSVEEFTDVYLKAEAARDAANGADNADATLEKKFVLPFFLSLQRSFFFQDIFFKG